MMYVRFPLSLRNVEDLLNERGIDICLETVGYWWNRFRPTFAAEIRKCHVTNRSYSNWWWHLDEVFVKINGETQYLWRIVDHEGEVLESFVTKRRNRTAALVAFLKKAMKRYGQPKVIVTDQLRSYRAALKAVGNQAAQEVGRWKNNLAENSHSPFRRRERAMSRFRLKRSLQKFSSIHSAIFNHFNFQRHLVSRDELKIQLEAALIEWQQLCAA
jgi:putative transposase